MPSSFSVTSVRRSPRCAVQSADSRASSASLALSAVRVASLLENPRFVARVEIDLWALEITNLRVLSAQRRDSAPGPEASILKIRGSEIAQRSADLMMKAVGPDALPTRRDAIEADWQPGPDVSETPPAYTTPLAATYLNQRKLSIFGGTNKIQKGIIAKMIAQPPADSRPTSIERLSVDQDLYMPDRATIKVLALAP